MIISLQLRPKYPKTTFLTSILDFASFSHGSPFRVPAITAEFPLLAACKARCRCEAGPAHVFFPFKGMIKRSWEQLIGTSELSASPSCLFRGDLAQIFIKLLAMFNVGSVYYSHFT